MDGYFFIEITIQIGFFCIQNKDNVSLQVKTEASYGPLWIWVWGKETSTNRRNLHNWSLLMFYYSKPGLGDMKQCDLCLDKLTHFSYNHVCVCTYTCTYLYACVSCRGGTCSFNSVRETRHSIPFPSIREEELVLQPTPFPLHYQDSPETTRSPSKNLCCLR